MNRANTQKGRGDECECVHMLAGVKANIALVVSHAPEQAFVPLRHVLTLWHFVPGVP